MADTAESLQRLQLSAHDLKRITAEIKPGEPWPDALVEDYLNILRDLILLANEIDANAGELFRQIDELFQIVAILGPQISRNRALINTQRLRSNDLEQLIHAW